ncbi:leucine-rich repeat-containing protein, partial [Tanacetum coccineum]
MRETIYFYFMHTHILFILSLVLLWFNTTTATSHDHQLVAAAGQAVHKCVEKERQALLDFKALIQDPYDMLSTWRPEDDDCCQWFGVTCNNQTGHVTKLALDGGLEGEITLSLLNLTYLSYIELYDNSFNGTFPKFICSMTHLTFLSLYNNEFTGTIPESIGNMTQLTYLDLHGNNFSGTIPTSIGSLTKLTNLYLSWNKFSGTIPMSIGSLTKLTDLSLSWNKFSGTIPMSIGSLTKLTALQLSDNSFYGTIPRDFGNLTNLEYLFLNSLRSCRVENLDWLSSLSSLEYLTMDGTSLAKTNNWVNVIIGLQNLNYLSLVGCDLSHVMHPYSSSVNSSSSIELNGTISDKFGQLPNLQRLDLSSNSLMGAICENMLNLSQSVQFIDFSSNKLGPHFPKWIQKLKNLIYLDLSNNSISDTVSTEYWNRWKSPQLSYLDLSFNNISGKLPKSLSNHDLVFIDLSFNCFYGPIPAFPASISFVDLSRNKFHGGLSFLCQLCENLEFLNISRNRITGQLPDCFRSLTNLKVLNLGHNILSGRIPPSIGYLGQLETLCLYNNSFSGELPLNLKNCTKLSLLDLGAIFYMICQLESLQILDLSFNNLHGTIPPCVNTLTSMVQKGFFLEQNKHHYRRFFKVNGDVVDNSYIDHLLIKWQGK